MNFRNGAKYCFTLFGTSLAFSLLEDIVFSPNVQVLLLTSIPLLKTIRNIRDRDISTMDMLIECIDMFFAENIIYRLTNVFARADLTYSTSLQLSSLLLGLIYEKLANDLKEREQNEVDPQIPFPHPNAI